MKRYNILFLCTGNSARSILGEALCNHLPMLRERFVGYSAGSFPRGEVNPMSIEVLTGAGIPTDGLRSKSWDEFAKPDAPQMDFIFTVCDQAAGETCPVWPGHPVTAHWGLPDPAAVEGDRARRHKAFSDTLGALRLRLELLGSLPLDKLDRMALHRHLRQIGETP